MYFWGAFFFFSLALQPNNFPGRSMTTSNAVKNPIASSAHGRCPVAVDEWYIFFFPFLIFTLSLLPFSEKNNICRCETTTGIDIDPHTAGLGWAPGAGIADCCAACSSAVWWNKGCRFYTFSKGRCWLKTNNATVVKSAGVCYHSDHLRTPWPPPLTAPNLPTSGSPHRRIRARLLHQACSGVDRSFSSNLSL